MIAEEVLKKSVKALQLCVDDYNLDNYLDDFGGETKIRAKISSVLYSYYRNKLSIDFIIKSFVKNKVKPKIYDILSVATTQILYQTGIRPEVAVDVAVIQTKKIAGRGTSGFVNAVLRNIVRSKDKIDTILINAPEYVRINIPEYVLKRWGIYYSQEEVDDLVKLIKQPQNNIYYRFLNPKGEITPIPNSETAVIDNFKSDFTFFKSTFAAEIIKSDALREGQIYIQDPATSLAVSSINSKGKFKILDACAAPGGKTLMLSELYKNSRIYAMDRSQNRLEKVKQNIEKANCSNVEIVVSDVINTSYENNYFDIVFLDVPCSNSGVVRKRPDVLWKLNEEHINDIISLQKRILDSAKKIVKQGGKLVYSTCSIEADENIYQIEKFLNENKDFEIEFQQQLLPGIDNDGAFVSVMIKQ